MARHSLGNRSDNPQWNTLPASNPIVPLQVFHHHTSKRNLSSSPSLPSFATKYVDSCSLLRHLHLMHSPCFKLAAASTWKPTSWPSQPLLSPPSFPSATNSYSGLIVSRLLANFLANTISLFPRLKKVRLLVPKISKGGQTYLSPFPQQVPDWLGHAISLFISGRPLAWQASELWTVSWPQQVGNGQCVESSEVWDLGEYGHEARQALWTTCCLKQKNESQRTVRVECQAVERQEEVKHHKLKLRELEDAAEQLPLRVVNGGLGLQWDGEAEWWTKRKYKRSFFSGWRG